MTTVTQWLFSSLESNGFELHPELKRLAKEYELRQMEDAWNDGYHKAKDDIICDTFSSFNKYYSKNYES